MRTSSGTFLSRGRDKVVRNIEKRIADFTFIPVGMQLRHSLTTPLDFSNEHLEFFFFLFRLASILVSVMFPYKALVWMKIIKENEDQQS